MTKPLVAAALVSVTLACSSGVGTRGDTGAQGAKGEVGATGPAGTAGAKGDKGDKGDTGAAGSAGTKGDKGDPGTAGQKGDKGDQGLAGLKGDKGDKGDPGTMGPSFDVYDKEGKVVGKLVGAVPSSTFLVWQAGDDVIWALDVSTGAPAQSFSQLLYKDADCKEPYVSGGVHGWGLLAYDAGGRNPPKRPFVARGLPVELATPYTITAPAETPLCTALDETATATAVTELELTAYAPPLALHLSGVPQLRQR